MQRNPRAGCPPPVRPPALRSSTYLSDSEPAAPELAAPLNSLPGRSGSPTPRFCCQRTPLHPPKERATGDPVLRQRSRPGEPRTALTCPRPRPRGCREAGARRSPARAPPPPLQLPLARAGSRRDAARAGASPGAARLPRPRLFPAPPPATPRAGPASRRRRRPRVTLGPPPTRPGADAAAGSSDGC